VKARKAVVLLVVAFLLPGCRVRREVGAKPFLPAPPRKEVLVAFVPCAFQRVAKRVKPEFERTHPNVRVEMHVENLEVLVRRIAKKGERPDILLSVGDKEVEFLERKGLVAFKKTFCFTTISLIVPSENPAGVRRLEDLTKPSVRTVGLGEEATSVGFYARQLLKRAGLWERVRPKVVEVEYPVQLLHMTKAGKFDAAIHYSSCVVGEQGGEGEAKAVETFVKGERCVTIPCPAAVIKGCERPDLGRLFAEFLTTEFAQKVVKEGGFLTLSESKCY